MPLYMAGNGWNDSSRPLRRPVVTPRLPVTLPVCMDRSNGGDMDALIKTIRPAKGSEAKPQDMRPAELDPSEILYRDSFKNRAHSTITTAGWSQSSR